MVIGDRLWGTSAYSKVVETMCQGLVKLGCEVAHTPIGRSMRGAKMGYGDVLIYPSGNNPWSDDVAVPNYVDFNADLLITVKENWLFEEVLKYAISWSPYCVIDHSPVSYNITSRLHTCFKPIAISRFGQRELEQKGIKNSVFIPHDVDTKVFRPLGKKKECKKLFGLPEDDFTVGMIQMNRLRKMIPHQLRGYKLFIERNPDIKSHLWFWGSVYPQNMDESDVPSPGIVDSGTMLLPEIMELGLDHNVIYPGIDLISMGLPEWSGEDYLNGLDMVKMMNACDVHLLATGGEGFGRTLIESQACGVGCVGTNYTAIPENIGAGYLVSPKDYFTVGTLGARYAIPSEDDIAEQLTKMYNTDREKMGRRARMFAEKYDTATVLEKYWKPFIQNASVELKPKITSKGVESW